MDSNLPLQIKNFNNKVRALNQANSKILTLNADEARSLQAEIFDLLAIIAGESKKAEPVSFGNLGVDGGTFK